jgi:hypothetical protein
LRSNSKLRASFGFSAAAGGGCGCSGDCCGDCDVFVGLPLAVLCGDKIVLVLVLVLCSLIEDEDDDDEA